MWLPNVMILVKLCKPQLSGKAVPRVNLEQHQLDEDHPNGGHRSVAAHHQRPRQYGHLIGNVLHRMDVQCGQRNGRQPAVVHRMVLSVQLPVEVKLSVDDVGNGVLQDDEHRHLVDDGGEGRHLRAGVTAHPPVDEVGEEGSQQLGGQLVGQHQGGHFEEQSAGDLGKHFVQ